MKEINTYLDLYIEFPAKVIEIENWKAVDVKEMDEKTLIPPIA